MTVLSRPEESNDLDLQDLDAVKTRGCLQASEAEVPHPGTKTPKFCRAQAQCRTQEAPKALAAELPNMSAYRVPGHPECLNLRKQILENPTRVLEIERALVQVIGAEDQATLRYGHLLLLNASPILQSGGVLCAATRAGKTMTRRKEVRSVTSGVELSVECRPRSQLSLLSMQPGQFCFQVSERPSIARRS